MSYEDDFTAAQNIVYAINSMDNELERIAVALERIADVMEGKKDEIRD